MTASYTPHSSDPLFQKLSVCPLMVFGYFTRLYSGNCGLHLKSDFLIETLFLSDYEFSGEMFPQERA